MTKSDVKERLTLSKPKKSEVYQSPLAYFGFLLCPFRTMEYKTERALFLLFSFQSALDDITYLGKDVFLCQESE